MHAVTTIGLDIAKPVFQVHGVDAEEDAVLCRQLTNRHVLFFREVPMPGRYRLWVRGSQGAQTQDTWRYHSTDAVNSSFAKRSHFGRPRRSAVYRAGTCMDTPMVGSPGPPVMKRIPARSEAASEAASPEDTVSEPGN